MIAPQVGMPVLYFPSVDDRMNCTIGQPLAATIVRAWTHAPGECYVNLVVFDATGVEFPRQSVSLLQGSDNHKELYGVAGRFCEFPLWFQRLMAPPLVTYQPQPIEPNYHGQGSLMLLATPAPAGTRDSITCGDSRCVVCAITTLSPGELAGCQPTSQVLG